MFYDRNQNIMLNSTQQISEFMKLLHDYLEKNPKTGYIVFQVFQESAIEGRLPVANAIVTVNKYIGDGYFVSKVVFTDSDGKTDPIPFYTTDREYSMAPGSNHAYETYSARIESPDFITTDIFDIQIFDGITGIQSVVLSPKRDSNSLNL